jgi:hypothetical protein
MTNPGIESIWNAIRELNWKYGTGDVVQVIIDKCGIYDKYSGFFSTYNWPGKEKIRKWRISNKTLFALGHQIQTKGVRINAKNNRVAYVKELPQCDYCKEAGEVVNAEYDAKTKYGYWANVCKKHFNLHCIGLGLGVGQKLEIR